MCAAAPGTPFCVNTADEDNEPDYRCAQCGNNCDCPIGQYCVKAAGLDTGSCKALESDIIGRPCNSFWVRVNLLGSESEQVIPVKDVDDKMVCGIPVFMTNGSFSYYEWLGYCDMGVCKQCGNLGGEVDEIFGYIMNPQTLQCPGRECRDATIVATEYAQSWTIVDEIMPKGVPTAILVFLVFIFFFQFFRCVRDCRGFKRGPYRLLDEIRTELNDTDAELGNGNVNDGKRK